jgi:MFS transporter, FHS family, L-fucose permease
MAQLPPNSENRTSIPKGNYLIPFILVTSLFFLWGIANSLNGTLVKQFQIALDINRFQAGFVESAFYIGYFVMAIPAGIIMNRYGYKVGIIIGLVLYAIGAFLFYPAANVRSFGFFLTNLFIIASGLGFIETAANLYVTILGDPSKAEQRINLSQSFNGLSIIFGPIIGGLFVFSNKDYTRDQLAAMPFDQAEAIRATEAQAVQLPYLILGAVLVVMIVLFMITKMPEVKQEGKDKPSGSIRSLFGYRHLMLGVLAQFFYVGAQTCIWGYFVDIKLDLAHDNHFGFINSIYNVTQNMSAKQIASFHASFAMAIFMIGRFVGTWLMSKFSPSRLLGVYAIACTILIIVAMMTNGLVAIAALILSYFFMSIMFPTIFALATKDLGEKVNLASSLVIMGIVGGAIMPPLMGLISKNGLQVSLIIPLIGFIYITYYGFFGTKTTS